MQTCGLDKRKVDDSIFSYVSFSFLFQYICKSQVQENEKCFASTLHPSVSCHSNNIRRQRFVTFLDDILSIISCIGSWREVSKNYPFDNRVSTRRNFARGEQLGNLLSLCREIAGARDILQKFENLKKTTRVEFQLMILHF